MIFFTGGPILFKRLALSAAVVLALFFAAGRAYCFEPVIDELKVDNNSDVKVNFTVANAFTKEIEEAIRSGVPTSFTFFLEMSRVKNNWFNEGMGKWQFKHTVKYDTLKEEYEITRDEAEPVKTKDFVEMKRIMTTAAGITLNYDARMEAGQECELRIKAELRTVKLPFLLNYMFFFVRYWDVETDWYTYNFLTK